MKTIIKIFIFVALIGAVVVGANFFSAHRPMMGTIGSISGNKGIDAVAYHQWLINPNVLVVDVRGVDLDRSISDVTRVFLSYAEKMKDRSFDKVILASSGTGKFYVDGEYFQRLGKEFGEQNPIYTIRTFPQYTKRMDGDAAFSTWTGGLLGVMKEQMEDFNNLHRQWWLDDQLARFERK